MNRDSGRESLPLIDFDSDDTMTSSFSVPADGILRFVALCVRVLETGFTCVPLCDRYRYNTVIIITTIELATITSLRVSYIMDETSVNTGSFGIYQSNLIVVNLFI